ncbi:helix-turn-helix transcriptional regulator [Allochromatium vinosum]|uniref:helix-turn-helix transcriptional regulator n=1 Tax=Allochromatium vinosum TaxID=1049 RepID=UPI0001A7850F|nr:helix-turn-helix domain-containing protein [Allochromatium vinosum]
MPAIRENYLTKDEAAEELGVTARTLDRWFAERIGPPRTKIGKLVLYRKAALVDWVAKREEHPVREQAA